MRRHKDGNAIRTNAVIVVMCCLIIIGFVTSSYSAENRSMWQKRQQGIQSGAGKPETAPAETTGITEQKPTKETLESLVDPLDIYIPDQYGSIIETHRGTNGKLIVHIQDAHANYEAQLNSANILESLVNSYNLSLILREGSATIANYTYIRDWGSLEARKNAADKLLKEAVISGIDYLDITSDYKLSFQGIENKALYEENKNLLWEIDKFKEQASEYIDKLITASDAVKPHIYNEKLLELDKKKKDYANETIDLINYYDYLYKSAEKENLPLYTFPNFQNLVKATDIEKKLDLVKVRSGDATEEEMKLYNEYLDLTRNLNVNQLFKEEPLLENFITDTLTENADQRNMLKVSKSLEIMKNMLRIKVVPEEYNYFKKNKKDFDPQVWTNFIKEKSEAKNLSLDMPNNYFIISDKLPKIEKFYNIAEERNKVFLKNAEERLNKDNLDFAALVAGGFHTPRLTQLLADRGFSYVVISPKVTTETDESLYRAQLKRN